MRTFMQEYGRAILAAIIGSISIGICYTYLTNHIFQVKENETGAIVVSVGDEPVIVAPNVIKIDMGDGDYDAIGYAENRESEAYRDTYKRYLNLVDAYENSACDEKCYLLTVAGIEQIHVERPGRYQVIYRAENANGRSFTKVVPVIVR